VNGGKNIDMKAAATAVARERKREHAGVDMKSMYSGSNSRQTISHLLLTRSFVHSLTHIGHEMR
jgi:hypothetical protein